MNTHVDKTEENKSQQAANDLTQKQDSRTSAFRFSDNRPEAIVRKKLQEEISNSPRTSQLRAIQELSDTGPKAQQAAQLQAMAMQHAQRKLAQFMKIGKTEKEEPVQGNFETAQKQSETPENNTGLPGTLRSGIENLSGHSMDDVKVHYNSDKPVQLNAHAYAQGTDIHLASGQEKHLPHEAWHVVQQKQGRVTATTQLKGTAVNDDPVLEQEADSMGLKAMQFKAAESGGITAGKNNATGKSAPQLKTNGKVTQLKGGKIPAGGDKYYKKHENDIPKKLSHAIKTYHELRNDAFVPQLNKLNTIISEAGNAAEEAAENYDMIKCQFFGGLASKAKEEKTVVQQQITQSFNTAKAAHRKDRTMLKDLIEEGLKSNNRMFKNSCEWIKAGKTNLFAVTSTGDSEIRALVNQYGGTAAYFPYVKSGSENHIYGAEATYDPHNLESNDNVEFVDINTNAWRQDGRIAIVNPSEEGKKQVIGTLTHEVQHDADKSAKGLGRDLGKGFFDLAKANYENDMKLDEFNKRGEEYVKISADVDRLNELGHDLELDDAISAKKEPFENKRKELHNQERAEDGLREFKTEYRAYSYQLSDEFRNNIYQVDDAKKQEIKNHIINGYPKVTNAWNKNLTLADGRKFKDAVNAYIDPDTEGFNKYNSVRVDDFYNALDAIGEKEAPTGPAKAEDAPVSEKESDAGNEGVKKLIDLIVNKLDGYDANYILTESPSMKKKIGAHLGGNALTAVNKALSDVMKLKYNPPKKGGSGPSFLVDIGLGQH